MSEEVIELLGIAVVGGVAYVMITGYDGGPVGFPPPKGATFDANGVRNIYPTSGSQFYRVVNSDNPELNRREWEIPGLLLNQEVTVYTYLKSGKDTVSIKMRGSDHTDTHPSYGCCYIVEVPFPNTAVRNNNLQKECPHGSGNYCGQRTATHINIPNMYNRWIGIKALCWNQMYNGKLAVRLQGWLDNGNSANKPANLWRLWFDVIDYGSISGCNTSALKPPFTRSPWGGGPPKVFIRIDNSPGANIKWVSAREIRVAGIVGQAAKIVKTESRATQVKEPVLESRETNTLERTPIF